MTIGPIFEGHKLHVSPPFLAGQATLLALAALAHKGLLWQRFGENSRKTDFRPFGEPLIQKPPQDS